MIIHRSSSFVRRRLSNLTLRKHIVSKLGVNIALLSFSFDLFVARGSDLEISRREHIVLV